MDATQAANMSAQGSPSDYEILVRTVIYFASQSANKSLVTQTSADAQSTLN